MSFLLGQLPLHFCNYRVGRRHKQHFISLIDPEAKVQCFPGTPPNISVVPFSLLGIKGGIVEGSQHRFDVTIGRIFTDSLLATVAPLTLHCLVNDVDALTCHQGQWEQTQCLAFLGGTTYQESVGLHIAPPYIQLRQYMHIHIVCNRGQSNCTP